MSPRPRTIPDADVPGSDDTVRTGAGLVLPRRPALQSPGGYEVTLPPEPEQTDPVIAKARDAIARRQKEAA